LAAKRSKKRWLGAAGFLLSSSAMRTEALLLAASLAACATNSGNNVGGGDGGDGSGSGDSCTPVGAGASTMGGDAMAGYVDGNRCAARFANPVNVAVSPDGHIFVADFDNGKLRVMDAAGNTSTAVTQPGFVRPFGMAFAPNGTMYVTTDNDTNGKHSAMSGTIWKINIAAKTATPITGSIGRPRGLAVLQDGRLVATDYENHVVEIVDPNTGGVTTLAGTFGASGFADGAGAAARFAQPYGVVQRKDGSLVVIDYENQKLRIVTLAGAVTTMAGTTGGFADGSMAAAKFNHPQGLSIDSNDNLYLTDTDNFRVRMISGSNITTIAGNGTDGYVDADDPTQAEFHGLEGLSVTADGSKVYVADGTRGEDVPFNHVRVITLH
jgi:DNA-binding beta-propeller fold protein YncE